MKGLQASFAGGELAPSLHARVDLAKYKTGAKLLHNCIVHAHGGISNRPGLQFITEVRDSTKATVLIPFEAATDDAYILEFSPLKMRIIRNDALVKYPSGHPSAGLTVEITHVYAEADLPYLHFEQANDVLTITHETYPPKELQRLDHHDWVFANITHTPSVPRASSLSVVPTTGFTDTASGYFPETHTYSITAFMGGEEGQQSTPASANNDLNYKPNFNTLSWPAVAGAERYGVFKARNSVYGLIGFTTALSFVDRNYGPNLGDGPPQLVNPFTAAGSYPATVAFYQQRRLFGATTARPQTIWGSQSGAYRNMSRSTPLKDDDALEFTIAARSRQTVLHLVSVDDLIVFTPSTEFRISGQNDGVLTPTSINIKPQSYYGSSKICRPLVVGDKVLFVQAKGQKIRDIGYSFENNKYVGNDLTILAEHLFQGLEIIHWTYAQAPNFQIPCIMSSGVVRALTYMREHEVWAWARQETRGFYEHAATISAGQEDATYFVVRRYINGAWRRYIEKTHSRTFADIRDAFFVDCGLSLNVPITITAATAATETVFTAAAHGLVDGDEVEAYSTVTGPDGETLPIDNYIVLAATTNTFKLKQENTGVVFSSTGWPAFGFAGIVRKKVQTIAGLGHLEGEAVVGLADGNVIGADEGDTLTVTGGAVTLPYKAARVHLGLPYRSDVETLDMEPGQGTAQGVIRSIPKVVFKVERSRGFKAGPDFDHLYEAKIRETEPWGHPTEPKTGDVEVAPHPKWDRHGRVCIRQDYPLPMTLLSFVPEVVYGG